MASSDEKSVNRPIEPEQVRAQLRRVLASEWFEGAPTLQDFLRFIVEIKLRGEEAQIKEYTIGVEVFHRDVGYDPSSDAIVRVQATTLRRRLRQYYERAGPDDRILIEIPKGHYVPRFSSGPLLAAPGQAETTPAPRRRRFGIAWGWLLVAFFFGILAAQLASRWKAYGETEAGASGSSGKVWEPAMALLWKSFLDSGAPTTLAFGTPQLFGFGTEGVLIRDTRVNTPAEIRNSEILTLLENRLGLAPIPKEFYTGIGEANGIHALSQFFAEHGHSLQLVRSSFVHWKDFKTGNVIFLSSARFNTLINEMEIPLEFYLEPSTNPEFVDRHPGNGESGRYRLDISGSPHDHDFATIALVPGESPGTRIMLLSGLHTWGTQGAAEYVVNGGYLRDLQSKLLARGTTPKFFQVLLRVEVRDNYPTNVSYVKHRELHVPPTLQR